MFIRTRSVLGRLLSRSTYILISATIPSVRIVILVHIIYLWLAVISAAATVVAATKIAKIAKIILKLGQAGLGVDAATPTAGLEQLGFLRRDVGQHRVAATPLLPQHLCQLAQIHVSQRVSAEGASQFSHNMIPMGLSALGKTYSKATVETYQVPSC